MLHVEGYFFEIFQGVCNPEHNDGLTKSERVIYKQSPIYHPYKSENVYHYFPFNLASNTFIKYPPTTLLA